MEQELYPETGWDRSAVVFRNDTGGISSEDQSHERFLSISADTKPDTDASDELSLATLTIGVIDSYRFSRECLIKALEGLQPQLRIKPFLTLEMCITENRADIDLLIYYCHASETSDTELVRDLATICEVYPGIPLVVLSDADGAQQAKMFRNTLKSGAHGFIPTKTTGVPITLAAIRLVKEGGTFAPMDLAMTNRVEHVKHMPEPVQEDAHPLTDRQIAVLAHMRYGRANKIIAYELNISESTVKVHIRNIMRKVGATNRTQAVYMAQKLLDGTAADKTFESR